jgi:hypothetical protein
MEMCESSIQGWSVQQVRGAGGASDGDDGEGAWGGASRHADQHGQSGVDVLESRPMEGGGGAGGASDGDECKGAWRGASRNASQHGQSGVDVQQSRPMEGGGGGGGASDGDVQEVLGEKHPDTLTSMNNLAFTWKEQSRDEKAIALMHECVQLRKKVLGAEHHLTLSSIMALDGWKHRKILFS